MTIAFATEKYVRELSSLELEAYELARDHFGRNHYLHRTTGFLAWREKQAKRIQAVFRGYRVRRGR